MKNKGFTLLELLVVVLIIGILAAIALPQYNRAVMKAKMAQLDVIIDTSKKNIDAHLNAHGFAEASFTGTDSIADIELSNCDASNYPDGGWCAVEDVGAINASCSGEDEECSITFDSQYNGGLGFLKCIYFDIAKSKKRNFWHISALDGGCTNEYYKYICQYFKDRNYLARENSNAPDICADVGITLKTVE